MFLSHREQLAHPGFLGAYFFIGLMGAHTESRQGILVAAAAVAVLAAIAWLLSLRRVLAMDGTPTSRIASAAQGYVELSGHAKPHPDGALRSRSGLVPCVWYSYTVEERKSDGKWHRIDGGRSEESFLLDDGSGVCLVDPEHAEILPARSESSMMGDDYRYTEWMIRPNERVYAIGQFHTFGGDNVELNLSRDVSALLAEWKRNQPALLKRFDLDHDARISEKEWMLARAQAKREVRKTHNEIRTQPGTHLLHRPHNGRLFLISNIDPDKLTRRYKAWAWVHLVVLVSTVAGAAWFATQ